MIEQMLITDLLQQQSDKYEAYKQGMTNRPETSGYVGHQAGTQYGMPSLPMRSGNQYALASGEQGKFKKFFHGTDAPPEAKAAYEPIDNIADKRPKPTTLDDEDDPLKWPTEEDPTTQKLEKLLGPMAGPVLNQKNYGQSGAGVGAS